jgi:hypothetical protein
MKFAYAGDKLPENKDRKPEFTFAGARSNQEGVHSLSALVLHQQKAAVFLIAIP